MVIMRRASDVIGDNRSFSVQLNEAKIEMKNVIEVVEEDLIRIKVYICDIITTECDEKETKLAIAKKMLAMLDKIMNIAICGVGATLSIELGNPYKFKEYLNKLDDAVCEYNTYVELNRGW